MTDIECSRCKSLWTPVPDDVIEDVDPLCGDCQRDDEAWGWLADTLEEHRGER